MPKVFSLWDNSEILTGFSLTLKWGSKVSLQNQGDFLPKQRPFIESLWHNVTPCAFPRYGKNSSIFHFVGFLIHIVKEPSNPIWQSIHHLLWGWGPNQPILPKHSKNTNTQTYKRQQKYINLNTKESSTSISQSIYHLLWGWGPNQPILPKHSINTKI